MSRIAVIGAGAWGTALACVLARAGRDVRLWAREPEVVAAIAAGEGNPIYLPDLSLPAGIHATNDLHEATAGAEAVLLVVPVQFLRGIAKLMQPGLQSGVPMTLCSKGVERGSGDLVTEIAAEAFRPATPVAVLSGPTFAAEVARDLPTAVTLAGSDAGTVERLSALVGTRHLRPYLSDDPVGAALGGAVKNVLAIACGICAGRRLGDNARAALVTRGLAEMARLGLALGARPETMMGLSGLGDLTLTCGSLQSRNMSLGAALGEGRSLTEIQAERHSVAEGVATAEAVVMRAARHGVEMPICAAVDRILNHGEAVETAIGELLSRPFRVEAMTAPAN